MPIATVHVHVHVHCIHTSVAGLELIEVIQTAIGIETSTEHIPGVGVVGIVVHIAMSTGLQVEGGHYLKTCVHVHVSRQAHGDTWHLAS